MSFDTGKFRNSDGSTDFDVGPTVPKRFETHGIPSVSVLHGYVIPSLPAAGTLHRQDLGPARHREGEMYGRRLK